MIKKEIAPHLYYVGVNDRTKHKFESLWPLPLGVTYNSYLYLDEKIALIDAVDTCYTDDFMHNITAVIGERPIDYLVVHHVEPDHSAAIRFLLQKYPHLEIVTNAKAKEMIEGFYATHANYKIIKEGDTLSLGENKLQFYMTPMVHWPETMMSYNSETETLFSGDAFGCFGALNGGVIDKDMDVDKYWDEMYRYYACIVGKYGSPVQKALQKLSSLPLQMICTTHGPVWQEQRSKVVSIYDSLSRYQGEPGVVIAYGSMYGNTEKMAEIIATQLSQQGIKKIVMHNLSKSNVSYVLADIFKYDTLIIGSPTYTNELFPEVEALISKIESRGISDRRFGYFGSYAWAGAAVKRLTTFAEKMRWKEVFAPTEMKLGITETAAEACITLATEIATSINKIK